ncbi:Hypothetical protein NocV09_00402220 [Nannochloropsis oceanica]
MPQKPVVATASHPRRPVPGAFWLVVSVTFRRSEDVEIFKAAFAPLAVVVKENEAGTLSYGLAISDKDPLMVLIFERYVDKDDAYLRVHRSSESFQVFRPQLAALKANISGESYIESDLGFV